MAAEKYVLNLWWEKSGKVLTHQLAPKLTPKSWRTEITTIFAICDCDARRGPQKSLAIFETLHCDLRVRWKVASDLRFQAAISEPKPSFCGISGDLAPSTRKSLASGTEKTHKHKEFGQKLHITPPQGNPWPRKFFMFGASFPFRIKEKAYIKNFEGGLGGPKILYAEFLRVFFRTWNKKNLLKFLGMTFRPARKALEISRRFSGEISEIPFRISRPFRKLLSTGLTLQSLLESISSLSSFSDFPCFLCFSFLLRGFKVFLQRGKKPSLSWWFSFIVGADFRAGEDSNFQISESGGSSLNCLYCRNPYQTPYSLNCLPPFTEHPFFSLKSASSHPLPKNRLWYRVGGSGWRAMLSYNRSLWRVCPSSPLPASPFDLCRVKALMTPMAIGISSSTSSINPLVEGLLLPVLMCQGTCRERKFSPKFFWPNFFWTPLGSWTSAPSGHGRPWPQDACFSRISRAWPKFLPPDVRRDIRVDVRRISGPKTYSLGWFSVPEHERRRECIT